MSFNQASHFGIEGSTFNDVQGDQHTEIHIHNINIAALNHATEELTKIDQHRGLLEIILNRVNNLVLEVERQRPQKPLTAVEAKSINSACEHAEEVITTISSMDLASRLYHSEKITSQLRQTQDAIALATSTVELDTALDTHDYEAQIHEARGRDENSFSQHLSDTARSDQTILGALSTRTRGRGKDRYKLSSLEEAFVKLASDLPSASSEPERNFIWQAVNSLRRLSKRPASSTSVEPPSWHLNELEVTYSTDEESLLGSGGFGSVYRGEWNGLAVAVKVMNESLAQIAGQRSLELFRREVEAWAALSHPHILPFYGACFTASQPFIVSSLCQYGNARQFLLEYPEHNPMTILYQVTLAMDYLHGKNIIHCDLKADNVLIDNNKNALVADFGVAAIQTHLTSSVTVHHNSTQYANGTLRWMAPERLDGEPPRKSSDLYSFAITAWELYSDGGIPFSGVLDFALHRIVVEREKRPDRPASLKSDHLWTIICASWLPDPKERPTFSDLHLKLKILSTQKSPFLINEGASYIIQVVIFATPYNIVENTCWEYANGCTWSGLSTKTDFMVLCINGSGTSGALRFMNDSGDAFMVVIGVHNYKVWCDIVTDLERWDTGMKIHPTYYAGGERSGIALADQVSKVNAKGEHISLDLASSDGKWHSYSLIVK